MMSFPEIRLGKARPHTDRVKDRAGARRRRVANCLEVLEDRTLLSLAAAQAIAHAAIVSDADPAPTVSALSPTSGPLAGGTLVTITGTNFVTGATVDFGPTAATGVTVVSPTDITATSPTGTGVVDVTVTVAGVTSALNPPGDQFTYAVVAAPTVTGLTPTTGPLAGGTPVTITGTSFTGATAVDFGPTAATGVTVVNDTTITATSPAGTGVVDVTVVTPAGTSAIVPADQFTYAVAPAVTGLTPTTGPEAGGTLVTIAGTGFTGATAVDFGPTAATGVTVDSATQITATSPAGTGVVDVTVTTPGGTSPIVPADQFTYISPYVHIVGNGNPDQFLIEEDGAGNVDFSVNGVLVTSQPASTIVQADVSNSVGGNTLTVDSSNGLVAFTGVDPSNPNAAHQINFDGSGFGSILELTQTGGSVADTDTYTPGPIPGSGTSVISGGGSVQTVNFVNLAPVFDFVPATTLTVNGNNANNAITYAEGFFPPGVLNPTWGQVSVDNLEVMNFIHKDHLVINALAGDDTINPNNSFVPTGSAAGTTLLDITVNGGAGNDTLVVNAHNTPVVSTDIAGGIVNIPGVTPVPVIFANIGHVSVINATDALTGTPIPFTAHRGIPFSNVPIASFNFTDPGVPPTILFGRASDFVASIDWGDGTVSAGTIVANGTNGFQVLGSHTYTEKSPTGTFQVAVTVTDAGSLRSFTSGGTPVTIQDNAGATTVPSPIPVTASVAADGPRVTFAELDRLQGEVTLTFDDTNGPGININSLLDAANYSLTRASAGRFIVTSITVLAATPGFGNVTVAVVFNNGASIRGGTFQIIARAASVLNPSGIRDVAGNALDGEFYGPGSASGNGVPGGDFVANVVAIHLGNSGPLTTIGIPHPNDPVGHFKVTTKPVRATRPVVVTKAKVKVTTPAKVRVVPLARPRLAARAAAVARRKK